MRLLDPTRFDQMVAVPNPFAHTLYEEPEYRGGSAEPAITWECTKCGAAVANPEAHTHWHRALFHTMLDQEQRLAALEVERQARDNARR